MLKTAQNGVSTPLGLKWYRSPGVVRRSPPDIGLQDKRGSLARRPDEAIAQLVVDPCLLPRPDKGQRKVLRPKRSIMATTLVPQIIGWSAIALGLSYLLMTRCQSRVRTSSIESEYQQTLDRRLRALREEKLDSPTVSHISEPDRLILDQRNGTLSQALPSPGSSPSFSRSRSSLP
jgi:hypothetical protein